MIKKFAIGFLISLLILLGGASLFIYTNKDVIIHEMTKKLKSAGLNLELNKMDVHFWRSFPYASASVDGLSLSTLDDTPILTAQRLSFNLEIMKTLRGQIEVKKVILDNGHIHLRRDKNGRKNYEFKRAAGSNNSIDQSWHLDHVELIGTSFTYHDEMQGHLIRFKDINGVFDPLSAMGIPSEIELSAFGENLSISNQQYFQNERFEFFGQIAHEEQSLLITQANLAIAKTDLSFHGTLAELHTTAPKIDLAITKAEGRIERLPDFLPEPWFQAMTKYQSEGNYSAKAQIEGNLATSKIPKITIEADLSNVSLHHDVLQNTIERGVGRLSFQYGNRHAGHIAIKNFIGYHQEDEIHINLLVSSFHSPQLTAKINGAINLQDINPEIIPELLIRDTGRLRLEDFKIQSNHDNFEYNGRIHVNDVQGIIGGIAFSADEGAIDIDNQNLTILPTALTSLGEKHQVQGQLSLDTELYDLTITSPEINLNHFFDALALDEEPAAKKVKLTSFKQPKTTIRLNADQLRYDHIHVSEISADVVWVNNGIKISSDMSYCEGQVTCQGNYNLKSGLAAFNIESKGVNLKSIFNQWNDFGQDQITSKHILGKGDIQSVIQFDFIPGKEFDSKSISLIGGIRVKKGELIDVPMFKKFTTYINQKDLSHIRFNSLNNVFKIKNGRFFLPEMFIQSNAANIILAGNQTLNNQLNYAIKINAGQVLTKKLKKHNAKLKPVRASNKGFFNLHYLIRGPLSNFEYYTDKRAVNDKLEQSLFLRDEVIQKLSLHFDTDGRYVSPHLMQDIPEMEIKEDSEVEYIPGF